MGDIPRISYSQAQSWNKCQYAWKLSYKDKWTPKETKSFLTLGSLLHELSALHYSFPFGTDTWPKLLERIQEKLSVGEVPVELISTATRLMDRYVHDFAPFVDKDIQVLEIEKHFEVELKTPKERPFILEGYVDRIHTRKGNIWVVEDKSIGNSRFYSPLEIVMDSQFPTYCAALRQQGMVIFGVEYNMWNTYEYKDMKNTPTDKLFKRDSHYKTPAELDSIMLEFGQLVDDILDHEEHDLPYRRSLSRDCAKCWMQEPCLMDLKGIDPTPFLVSNFKKKEPRLETSKESQPVTSQIL